MNALVARAVLDREIEDAVAGAVLSALMVQELDNSGITMALPRRRPRPGEIGLPPVDLAQPRRVQVARGGDEGWAVDLGSFANRTQAEKLLLVAALQEFSALDGAFRKIDAVQRGGRKEFRARFVGLTKSDAARACAGLAARQTNCVPISPGT